MKTNEQLVVEAEDRIQTLKAIYTEVLTSITLQKSEGIEPSLTDLLKCQQAGINFFNFAENFVGGSDLLGAHGHEKWVTGFAETCASILEIVVEHYSFINSYAETFGEALKSPNTNAYANMQRMVKEYLPTAQWRIIKENFEKQKLPTSGFKNMAISNSTRKPKWQSITGIVIACFIIIILLVLTVSIPEPTHTQFFIVRGLFALAAAVLAALIPGLLNIKGRLPGVAIEATGAIAIFVLVWLINPPALIAN